MNRFTPKHWTTPQRLACALATTLLALAASAEARPTRDRLERALSAIESVPARKALLRHGTQREVVELLHQIVEQPSRRALARSRALVVLRHFPSPKTAAVLQRVIETNRHARRGLPILDLRQALTSYAVVAGANALALAVPMLSHPVADVRASAAEALRLSGSPRARALLEQVLASERNAVVRHAITEQIELQKKAAKAGAKRR